MKVYQTLILIAICCSLNLVHAQDIHAGGDFNPLHGSTTWGVGTGDGWVMYFPHEDGALMVWCDCPDMSNCPCEQAQCQGPQTARCLELLEYANGGPTPTKPDKGGKNPGKNGKNGKGNKPKSEIQEMIQGIPSLKADKVYFKTQEGKWVEIKDRKAWTQKIIQSL
ncbi:MAG: hypothetical protein WAT37_16920 [Saprospiraceae bacterium]